MRRLIWLVAGAGVVLWSLLAWGVYGLIDLFGSAVVRHVEAVGSYPGAAEWLSWGLAAVRNLGLAAVVLVWGFVSLLILAVPAVLTLLLGRALRPVERADPRVGYPRPGYRDVTPADDPPRSDEEPRRIERH
jgi:hypothetical protein